MPKYDPEYLKKKFPNLFEELEEEKTEKVGIDGVQKQKENENSERKEKIKKSVEKRKSLEPTVTDFLRLCDTEEEALEIINHMEEENKIDSERANDLRKQLEQEGLRSFGSKRKPGNYSFTD